VKRLALLTALVLAGIAATDVLGDLTQSRPERVQRGTRSDIVLDVESNGYLQSLDDGARNLWAACAGTTSRRLVSDGAFTEVEPGRYLFAVEPALGQHTRRKLVGCLEDITVDNLLGNVVSVTLVRD
jgi:hypothetical protein